MSTYKIIADAPNPNLSQPLSKHFWSSVGNSSSLTAAVGYVGAASIIQLDAYLADNPDFSLNLFIGMQYLEGFDNRQLQALKSLDRNITENEQGSLLFSTRMLHHGKQYFFHSSNSNGDLNVQAAYIGSANLEAISAGYTRTYESGIMVEGKIAKDLYTFYSKNIRPLGQKVELDTIEPKAADESPLEEFEGVSRVDLATLDHLKASQRKYTFDLPVKTQPRSNLNAFHGAPRKNVRTGRELRRPWYEAELIVSKSITTQDGYPSPDRPFHVITDDGWQFQCRVNGDYSKNFRSDGNLSIFGAWIKGRLESNGYLEVGDLITEETLQRYGRDFINLSYVPEMDTWYMDFKN